MEPACQLRQRAYLSVVVRNNKQWESTVLQDTTTMFLLHNGCSSCPRKEIRCGNNPMVGCTVAVAMDVLTALSK